MFKLTNARGETVDINTPSLRSYTPTGLGLQITNSYSPYETYFIPTKSVLSQGIMQVYMKFGDIESQSYQSFSDFAQFLAYQPYTLEYDFDDNTYYRDARLQSLTKTEIGGSTIDAFDRLNEIFTLEFINNWYNNKTAEYKSYDPDPNLGTYGKGFFNEIDQSSINNLENSDFNHGLNGWWSNDVNQNDQSVPQNITISGKYKYSNALYFDTSSITSKYYERIHTTFANRGVTNVSLSWMVKTIMLSNYTNIYVRFLDSNFSVLSSLVKNWSGVVGNDWSLLEWSNIAIPSGTIFLLISFQAREGTKQYLSQPMAVFDSNETNDYVTGGTLKKFAYFYGDSAIEQGAIPKTDIATTDVARLV